MQPATYTDESGRTYDDIVAGTNDLPALRASLLERGFDGTVYYGTSKPHGRQRVTLLGLFYRTVAGSFVLVRREVAS